ncbi:hypothetical protein ACSBR1_029444 [Camellia fascicularis]
MRKLLVTSKQWLGGCFAFSPPERLFSTKVKAFSTLTPNLRVLFTYHQFSQVIFGMMKLPVTSQQWLGAYFAFSPPEPPFSTKFKAFLTLTPNLYVLFMFHQFSQVIFGTRKLPVTSQQWLGGYFVFSPPEHPFSSKFKAFSILTSNLRVLFTYHQFSQVIFGMRKLPVTSQQYLETNQAPNSQGYSEG